MSTAPLVPGHLSAPLLSALSKLDPSRYRAALQTFEAAHAEALAVLAGEAPFLSGTAGREAILAKAAIDPAAALELAGALARVSLPFVDSGGVVWGFGPYEQLDPRWLLAVLAWLYYPAFEPYAPFPNAPQTICGAPDQMTIALLGDWGGGAESAAPVVLEQVQLLSPQPEYTIHLGDVYYFGAPERGFGGLMGDHAEVNKLVEPWPVGSAGAFALNSNHEMYAAAQGYFVDALGSPTKKFALQQGTSYFALENDAFVIVGLDSAYFAPWKAMYMTGAIDGAQQSFLLAQAAKKTPRGAPKHLVVLTHHTGLNDDGTATNALWSQIADALPAGTTCTWYWGHYHEAVVYTPRTGALGATIYPRCAGHGCIPYGNASALAGAMKPGPGTPQTVLWYESTPVASGSMLMLNGFVTLGFDGAQLIETFIDQDGGTYRVPVFQPARQVKE